MPSHHAYTLEPIHGEPEDDNPEVTSLLEAFFTSEGMALAARAPVVVGWRLRLRTDEAEVGMCEFGAGEAEFDRARDAGEQWLIAHGDDALTSWFCSARTAFERMGRDHDYAHAITMKGSSEHMLYQAPVIGSISQLV